MKEKEGKKEGGKEEKEKRMGGKDEWRERGTEDNRSGRMKKSRREDGKGKRR